MLLSISKRPLNGNPLLIFLVFLVLVVSTYDDSLYTRLTDLLIPSQEEIEDLSHPHGISGSADWFCDGCILGDALFESNEHAEATIPSSKNRPHVLSAPVYTTLHAYRAPPCRIDSTC